MTGTDPEPVTKRLADVEPAPAGSTPAKLSFARLITEAEMGSQVLFGVMWIEKGEESAPFTLDASKAPLPEQEVYYVQNGRIAIEWDGGRLEAGPETAIYLPAGRTYQSRGLSDEAATVLYVIVPAPG